jgi:hypothetical protein
MATHKEIQMDATTKAVLDRFIQTWHIANKSAPHAHQINGDWRLLYNGLVADGHLIKVDDRYFAKGHPFCQTYLDSEQAEYEASLKSYNERQAKEHADKLATYAARQMRIIEMRTALLSQDENK